MAMGLPPQYPRHISQGIYSDGNTTTEGVIFGGGKMIGVKGK